jgi:1,2-phenylacetyl-CoA epoxidase catalytic subunit
LPRMIINIEPFHHQKCHNWMASYMDRTLAQEAIIRGFLNGNKR